MQLTGKTALITGASRGIGKALAISLAGMGAEIGIVYLGSAEKAEQTKQEIEDLGQKCTLMQVDLSDASCAEKMKQTVDKADILIHNASIQYRRNWEKISTGEMEQQINCNFRAPLLITQKYIEHMKSQRWGRIITIGSVQEAKPHTDMLVYSAMKSALTAMTKSLAVQLAPFGITVNAVAPGVILTDRNSAALSDPDYYQTVLHKIPAGRCGEPIDCAGIIKLLCSEEGAYITGQNIFVDGGMSLS